MDREFDWTHKSKNHGFYGEYLQSVLCCRTGRREVLFVIWMEVNSILVRHTNNYKSIMFKRIDRRLFAIVDEYLVVYL